MDTTINVPLRMMENIGVANPLDKSPFNKLFAVFFLSSVCSKSGTIHMAKKFSTLSGVFHFRGQGYEDRRRLPVNLGIEVCPLDVNEAQL